MLVIGRRVDESVTITTEAGTRITIMVCSADMGQCRLGIDCPKHLPISRDNMRKGPPCSNLERY
jgi:carbon storage regulator CsrA